MPSRQRGDARSQRTFVTISGSDANACSLAAPCRSFATAIAATDAGGEVIVLDSGGYGATTITRSAAPIAFGNSVVSRNNDGGAQTSGAVTGDSPM